MQAILLSDQNMMGSNNRTVTSTSLAAQLTIFLVAVAILVPAVSPKNAVGGAPWIRIAFLARIVVLVGIAHWMLRRRSLGWPDVGLSRPNWPRLLIAVPAGLIMVVLFSGLTRAAIMKFRLQAPDYSAFAPIRSNLGEYLFWLLPVSIGTAAFGEELIFRGFVTDALRRLLAGSGHTALVTAIATQAVIFGGLHFYQGAGGMIIAGVTGLALGLSWLIAGRNLWAGILIHALLDGGAMTGIYLGYVPT